MLSKRIKAMFGTWAIGLTTIFGSVALYIENMISGDIFNILALLGLITLSGLSIIIFAIVGD